MESERCPKCFHIIGEHYLCRDHGGEFETAKVDKSPPKPKYPCPPEAIWYFHHEFYDFLDNVGKDE